MQKRTLKLLIISILIIFLISFVSAKGCKVYSGTICPAGNYSVMKLSSLANAHAQQPTGSYSNVLCCDFGTGTTTCSTEAHPLYGASIPKNKITGLSTLDNAHTQIPDQTIYPEKICYEDMICISTNIAGYPNCSVATTGDYPLDVLSLSSYTNAHTASSGTYPGVSICCKSEIAARRCVLSSASWSTDTAWNGQTVNLNVVGTNCAGITITFDIWEDDTIIGTGTLFDDYVTTITGPFPTGTVDISWSYPEDEGSETGAKEYYFVATVPETGQKITSSDPELIVNEQTIQDYCLEEGIVTCDDYNNEEDCNLIPDICSVAPTTTCPEGADYCLCVWDADTNPPECGSEGVYLTGINDFDGDGLSDEDEINIYGTNPYDSDSDNDGFSDGEEVRRGTKPDDPLDFPAGTPTDLDGDGLLNEDETNIYHTLPNDADTDNDGFSDGEEVYGPDGILGTGDETDPLDLANHPGATTKIKLGTCKIKIVDTGEEDTCEDDNILTYQWYGEWTGEGERPEDCIETPMSVSAPCVAQAQLSFFGIYQFIISFVLILGISFLMMRVKKRG